MFDSFIRQAFLLLLLCSGLPLLASSICGLLVSIFQTATQIQEQSISYLVKFGAVALVFAFMGSYFSTELVRLIQQNISSIAMMGRL